MYKRLFGLNMQNIDELVEKAKPLQILTDANGYICDSSTAVAKCPHGHIHRYFIAELYTEHTCKTCGVSGKFVNLVRESAEKLLGVPFIFTGLAKFSNPAAKIDIVATRHPPSTHEITDGVLTIKIYTTTSSRTIQNFIKACIITTGWSTLRPFEVSPNIRIMTPGPPPNSKELADSIALAVGCIKDRLKIVATDKLFLENC